MAEAIAMPRLGWTMKEGTLVEWLKADGDAVEAGEILFTVESDKALNEIETFSSGILRIPPDAPPPGAIVPVGTLLGYLLQPGEAMPTAPVSTPAAEPDPTPAEPAPAPKPKPTPTRSAGPTISPRARRVASALGVEWRALTGSGRTGRIVERDVRAAAARPQPLAHAVLTTQADATDLVALRARFKAAQGLAAPTYHHLLAKMTAVALGRYPLGPSRAVHLGLVVDTADGLVVPVLRDADSKSLAQLAARSPRPNPPSSPPHLAADRDPRSDLCYRQLGVVWNRRLCADDLSDASVFGRGSNCGQAGRLSRAGRAASTCSLEPDFRRSSDRQRSSGPLFWAGAGLCRAAGAVVGTPLEQQC